MIFAYLCSIATHVASHVFAVVGIAYVYVYKGMYCVSIQGKIFAEHTTEMKC